MEYRNHVLSIGNLSTEELVARFGTYDNAGARTGAIPIMVIVRGGEGASTTHSGH